MAVTYNNKYLLLGNYGALSIYDFEKMELKSFDICKYKVSSIVVSKNNQDIYANIYNEQKMYLFK